MKKTKVLRNVGGGASEPEATVTPMEILVIELVADLKALEAKIPHFQYPHPRTTRLVRTYRSVPKAFIKEMNDCVMYDAELQAVGTYDARAGAEALDFVTNFRNFSVMVGGFLRGLNFTIEHRHAEVAEKALQTYQIAKALRRRKGSSVVSKVPRMRAALNRAGKKRGPKKETKE
jgi:hypothetical protein